MIPVPHGGAASWFASLFGGTGQPTAATSAPADSAEAWSVFAAQLASLTAASGTKTDDEATTAWPTQFRDPESSEETDDGTAHAAAFGLTSSTRVVTTETPNGTSAAPSTSDEGPVADGAVTTTQVDGTTAPPSGVTPTTDATVSMTSATVGTTTPDTRTTATTDTATAPTTADETTVLEATASNQAFVTSDAMTSTTTVAADGATVMATERPATESASTTEDGEGTDSGPTVRTARSAALDVSAFDRPTVAVESTVATVTTVVPEATTPRPSVVRPEGPVNPAPATTSMPFDTTGDGARAATTTGEIATEGASATPRTDEAVTEAITRMRVERHVPSTRDEGRPALDLGSRVRVRPAESVTARPAPTTGAAEARDVRSTDGTTPQEPLLETITDELLEDEAAHDGTVEPLAARMTNTASGTDTDDEVGRTRAAAHVEDAPAAAPESQRAAAATRAAQSISDTKAPDLGARLRQAVVESLAAQAKDELLASAKDGWETRITVEPLQLGRVDVQVTQTPRGLEIILAAAHHEAARALEAEVDDLVDELVRRDLEPARVTVRSNDSSQDGDRSARNAQQEANARAKQAEDDDDTQTGEEGRRGRGRERQEARQQQAQA